jgi:hypothetical protein
MPPDGISLVQSVCVFHQLAELKPDPRDSGASLLLCLSPPERGNQFLSSKRKNTEHERIPLGSIVLCSKLPLLSQNRQQFNSNTILLPKFIT